MEINEIREGMKVRHQFEHGSSFGRRKFNTGTVVSTEGMTAYRPQLIIKLDEPVDGRTDVGVFAADLASDGVCVNDEYGTDDDDE